MAANDLETVSLLDQLTAESGLPASVVSRHHAHPVQLYRIWYCFTERKRIPDGTIGYQCRQCRVELCTECSQQQ